VGSGGALAIAVGDRVNMLEHSVYSVISPEGCASILWRDAGRAEEAATAMKITAVDLKTLGLVDEIIPEPAGGAHVAPERLFASVDRVLAGQLAELDRLDADALLEGRYRKFRSMGRLGKEFLESDETRSPSSP
jgi:acetyl-CoA carboxylase carboxyl transferase subunit alpha